jgi:hypothetical protein
MTKPLYIYCPHCSFTSVNRLRGKCIRCKIDLFYPGEYVNRDSSGFLWNGIEWRKVSDWFVEVVK